MGKPGFPIAPPGGWVWGGYALPGSMFIPSGCGASRMDGYREHRLLTYAHAALQPPS